MAPAILVIKIKRRLFCSVPTHETGTPGIRSSRSIHTSYITGFLAVYEDDRDMAEYSGLFDNLSVIMKLIVLLGFLAVAFGKLSTRTKILLYKYMI